MLDCLDQNSNKTFANTVQRKVSISDVFGISAGLEQEQPSESQNNDMFKAVNEAGTFILYRVANLFLSTDYEKCLYFSKINFSYVCNSVFFEGNILRYKALALEKIYCKNQKIYELQQQSESDGYLEDHEMIKINQ